MNERRMQEKSFLCSDTRQLARKMVVSEMAVKVHFFFLLPLSCQQWLQLLLLRFGSSSSQFDSEGLMPACPYLVVVAAAAAAVAVD